MIKNPNYNTEEIKIKLNELVSSAQKNMMQKGNEIEITIPVLYIMSIVDKSIKLIDSAIFALDNNNITVLAILTRVQMDCVSRAYAMKLSSNYNEFASEILVNNVQINKLKSSEGKKMTDKYLSEKVGEWLGLPVYDLYQKVCGFVHFSDKNFHTMISSYDYNTFSLMALSKNNPPEKEETFKRLSLELANQFYLFGDILINNLFKSYVKYVMTDDVQ